MDENSAGKGEGTNFGSQGAVGGVVLQLQLTLSLKTETNNLPLKSTTFCGEAYCYKMGLV